MSSIFEQAVLDFLIYLAHELRDYADGPAYDDEALSAYRFMDGLADEIMAFLKRIEKSEKVSEYIIKTDDARAIVFTERMCSLAHMLHDDIKNGKQIVEYYLTTLLELINEQDKEFNADINTSNPIIKEEL